MTMTMTTIATAAIITSLIAVLIAGAKRVIEAKFPVPTMTDAHIAVLAALAEHGPMTPLEIAERLECGMDDPEGVAAVGELLRDCDAVDAARFDQAGIWRVTRSGTSLLKLWETEDRQGAP